MVTIQLGRGRRFEFSAPLDALPIETDEKPQRSAIVLVLFGLLVAGAPLGLFVVLLAQGRFQPSMLILLVFAALGALAFVFGLHGFTHRRHVTIDGGSVRCRESSCFGDRSWDAALRDYEGVLCRDETRSTGGKNSSSVTVHVLRLHHADDKHDVLLYQSESNDGLRRRWEDACRLLNVPAVEETVDGLYRRDVADLDRPVGELVREKKLAVGFDPHGLPPANLEVYDDLDSVEILVRAREMPLAVLPVALGLPALLIYVTFWRGASVVFALFGIVFGALVLYAIARDLLTTRRIVVRTDGIEHNRVTPRGQTRVERIEAATIESVTVTRTDLVRCGVQIATDERTVKLGEGLPRESLEWLKNRILAKLSE